MTLKEKNFMLFGLDPSQTSYRGIWLFFGVYAGATLLGAILTPPVYWGFHHFWPDMPEWLARKRVDVFFDRIRWVPIVAGIPVLIKVCGLASLANIGLSFTAANLRHFAKYALAGAGIASAVYCAQIAFANVSYRPMEAEGFADAVSTVLVSWFLGALLVALLEEVVFRALIFRCIYTGLGMLWAVALTSAFFAYKHFHVPSSIWNNIPGDGKVAEWYTGFIVAWYDTVGVFMNWDTVMFLALFMFGAVLSMIYVRTKVLWGPIGFHTGIVFAMFAYKSNVKLDFTPEQTFLFGGANPSSGLMSVILLSLMLAFLLLRRDNGAKRLKDAPGRGA